MEPTYSSTKTTETLRYASGDDYIRAVRVHSMWWESGDARNEPYRIGGQMVAMED